MERIDAGNPGGEKEKKVNLQWSVVVNIRKMGRRYPTPLIYTRFGSVVKQVTAHHHDHIQSPPFFLTGSAMSPPKIFRTRPLSDHANAFLSSRKLDYSHLPSSLRQASSFHSEMINSYQNILTNTLRGNNARIAQVGAIYNPSKAVASRLDLRFPAFKHVIEVVAHHSQGESIF